MTEIQAMIKDLIKAMRDAGVDIPDTVAPVVEARMRAQYGGCEIYVPKSPKGNKLVRIQAFGTSVPATFVARELGVTVRRVRQIRQLLRK
jgi:formylmethanofuran dehydrogenase subunit D